MLASPASASGSLRALVVCIVVCARLQESKSISISSVLINSAADFSRFVSLRFAFACPRASSCARARTLCSDFAHFRWRNKKQLTIIWSELYERPATAIYLVTLASLVYVAVA